MPRLTKKQKQQIFKLFDEGYKPKKVSELTGISYNQVCSQRKDYLFRKNKGIDYSKYNNLLVQRKGFRNYYEYKGKEYQRKKNNNKKGDQFQEFVRILEEVKIIGSIELNENLQENIYMKIFKVFINGYPKRKTYTHKQIVNQLEEKVGKIEGK